MYQVTTVLFTHEERGILTVCRPFIGLAAPDGPADDPRRHRQEWERHWNAVCQRNDLVSYESLIRALQRAKDTRDRATTESSVLYWQSVWADEVRSHGLQPGDQVFPTNMADVLVQSRARMITDLDAAIHLLDSALEGTTPRPPDDYYEGL